MGLRWSWFLTNMNDIARLADRLWLCMKEKLPFWVLLKNYLPSIAVELREIGLGIPHAQRLANELRELGFDLPTKLYEPETLADEIVKFLASQDEGR
mgnify:CR=1 FL=1